MKRCATCKQALPLAAFGSNKPAPDGLQYSCKKCLRLYFRAYYKANKEVLAKRNDEWRRAHRKAMNAAARRWAKRNRARVNQYTSRWYAKNPGAKSAHGKVYHAKKRRRLEKRTFCNLCLKMKPLHAHHSDYARPLKVVWLCAKCHAKERITP